MRFIVWLIVLAGAAAIAAYFLVPVWVQIGIAHS